MSHMITAILMRSFDAITAGKNNHTFLTPKQEAQALIYNYPTTYTGLKGITFDECYLFQN